MFNYLLKGIVAAIAVKVLDNYRHLSIQLLRIETAKSYLYSVRMAWLSAFGLMRMGLEIGLVCTGLFLFHAGLFVLLPWTVKAKALLGLILGLAYMVIGGFALRASMDERTWMEKSGATEMLNEATGQSKTD